MRTIKLNKTYITTFGTEFTPVLKESDKPYPYNVIGNQNSVFQNSESIYIDINGVRVRKSKLWYIKGESPPKKNRPTSTI